MGNHHHSLVVAVLLCAVVSVSASDEVVMVPELRDGLSTKFSQVSCTNEGVLDVLGALLAASVPSGETPAAFELRLLVRDVRPKADPQTLVMTSGDLIRAWSGQCTNTTPTDGDLLRTAELRVSLDLREVVLTNALQTIASVIGYVFAISSDGTMELGPAELVGEHPVLVRRGYELPPARRVRRLRCLPKELSLTGDSLAYDDSEGVLCIIDDPESINMVDQILCVMGFQQIGRSEFPEF